MRQTNIVWVGMALGCTVMEKLISQTLPFIKDSEKKCTNPYTFQVYIYSHCDFLSQQTHSKYLSSNHS